MSLKAGLDAKDGTTTPSEVRLETPLFVHECFTEHPTADDRTDRGFQDDEPFYPPKECLEQVFYQLSRRLLEEDSLRSDSQNRGPPIGLCRSQDENKYLRKEGGQGCTGVFDSRSGRETSEQGHM